ncbi:hypothetical protein Trydic_g5936 [Trypoxylus dichotomus]
MCIMDAVFRLKEIGTLLPTYKSRGRERPRKALRVEEELLDLTELNPGTDTNSHLARQCQFQYKVLVNVYASILGNTLLGPHVFLERLSGTSANDVLLDELRQMWFIDDGVPPHFSREVHDFSNAMYRRWIGLGDPRTWLPRNPDLNTLDLFVRESPRFRRGFFGAASAHHRARHAGEFNAPKRRAVIDTQLHKGGGDLVTEGIVALRANRSKPRRKMMARSKRERLRCLLQSFPHFGRLETSELLGIREDGAVARICRHVFAYTLHEFPFGTSLKGKR